MAVSSAPRYPITYSAQSQPPRLPTNSRISSWEKKPENGGTADRARPPVMKHRNVNGSALRQPDIRSSDCSPAIALISDPAAMKSSALKNACVKRWNMLAEYAPTDTPMIMYPICDIVE